MTEKVTKAVVTLAKAFSALSAALIMLGIFVVGAIGDPSFPRNSGSHLAQRGGLGASGAPHGADHRRVAEPRSGAMPETRGPADGTAAKSS